MAPPKTLERIPVTPLPVPRAAQGVVLFGGSFDPPHAWHTAVASAVRRKVFGPGGWIVFVPAAGSPLKDYGPVETGAERVEMLRRATARLKNVVIWTDELDRAAAGQRGPSYTIDTVERAQRALPAGVPMRLLIGSDQAAQFHRWREYRGLMKRAEPVVVRRPPLVRRDRFVRALRAAGAWSEAEIQNWLSRIVETHAHGMSSTLVRGVLMDPRRRGRSLERDLRCWVKAPVLAYIARRGLYQPPAR